VRLLGVRVAGLTSAAADTLVTSSVVASEAVDGPAGMSDSRRALDQLSLRV